MSQSDLLAHLPSWGSRLRRLRFRGQSYPHPGAAMSRLVIAVIPAAHQVPLSIDWDGEAPPIPRWP